jgi:GTP-binding protein
VCVLIDSRHGIKDSDEEMMALLDGAAVSFHSVLTKADKIDAKESANVLNAVAAATSKHTAGHPEVFVTSSETGGGLAELRAALASVALAIDSGYKPATAGRDRA